MVPAAQRVVRGTLHATALLAGLALAACEHAHASSTFGASSAPTGDSWGPLITLRDTSDAFVDGRPDGGWWVSPIHVTLLPSGRVLISGWGRREESGCMQHGGFNLNGVSFVFDPSTTAPVAAISPIDAQDASPDDALYCAGHVPIGNGRVLYAGGTRLLGGLLEPGHSSAPRGIQHGLDYARVFDALTESFVRIEAPMAGAPPGHAAERWYPTATRLSDGRVLVTGGLTACCEEVDQNRSLEIFDPARATKSAASPWQVLVPHQDAPPAVEIDNLDYPHVFLLPRPVVAGRHPRQFALVASFGTVALGNYLDPMPSRERLFVPSHGDRPAADGFRGLGSTAALLPTDEIMVAGHSTDATSARSADIYDPATDRWRRVDLGVARGVPSSVLLPDGTVMIANGFGRPDFAGDRSAPQILDPRTGTLRAGSPSPTGPHERGYHSFAVLLKDGSVLIGGGTTTTSFDESVHCESPTVQVYHPPYFRNGPRPVITGVVEPMDLALGGGPVAIGFRGPPPRARGGVVLMALGSMTHAFDQNQRYVALTARQSAPGRLEIVQPADGQLAPPGDYMLFLVSEAGVPSRAKYVRVRAS